MHRKTVHTAIFTTVVLLSGCAGNEHPTSAKPTSASSAATPTAQSQSMEKPMEDNNIIGTVVHFTTDSTVVEVVISEDTPTTRDFLSMLPVELTFEDFAGQEKITYTPRAIDSTGAEGMTPQVGDLFSYIPWGNLGFFYGVDGLGFSKDLVRIGTTQNIDQIRELEGQTATVSLAQ